MEAGLQRLIRTDKAFVGKEAALEQLATRPRRQLRLLAIESTDPDPCGGEPVLLDGEPVARLTSAAWGYTIGAALGFAYLPATGLAGARSLEVEIQGRKVPARVLSEAPYDPSGARLRQ